MRQSPLYFIGIISGVSDRRGDRFLTRSALSNKGLRRNGGKHYFHAYFASPSAEAQSVRRQAHFSAESINHTKQQKLEVTSMSQQSKWISEIGWDIKTSSAQFSETDTPVSVEILRDDIQVIALFIEPGNTPRLNRGASEFYWWRFQGANFAPNSSDIGHSTGGEGFPHGVEFPQDIQGHLKCRLRAWGNDKWIKDNIEGFVRYARLVGVPGTIDSTVWVDDLNWTAVGNFTQDVVISTDTGEGTPTWTLIY
jgi:hypothetical protein